MRKHRFLWCFLVLNIFGRRGGDPRKALLRDASQRAKNAQTYVFYDTFASPTIETHVFYDTFASPTIEIHVFYDTFASPTTETYVFYETFVSYFSKKCTTLDEYRSGGSPALLTVLVLSG